MAGTLSRFVGAFVAATPILSAEMNGELNQLVNLLAGTSSNIKLSVKVSDAGDAPLESNQLSTGPIFKGFQAGVEKFRVRNDGAIRAPGIYDPNDNEELLFVATASAVNEFTATNAATGGRPKLSATGGDANIGIDIIPKGTGVVKIQAGAPVANEDAANKVYVDNRRTWWSANWFIADPSTFPFQSFNLCQKACVPASATWVAVEARAMCNTGTASGSFSVEIRKHPFADQTAQTVLATVTFNSGAIGAGAIFDVNPDVALTSGDWLYPILSARSAPLQRDVQINLIGYQNPIS